MRVKILHIRPLKFETCIVYIFLLARILHVPTCVGISPIKPAPEDYAHPALQVYLVLMHTLKHTQLSLSYSFFFFFLFLGVGGTPVGLQLHFGLPHRFSRG